MKKNKNFELEYDTEGDILYITRGRLTKQDTSEELGDDIIVWKNKNTDELSGFTVLNFSKRGAKKDTSRVVLPIDFEPHPHI